MEDKLFEFNFNFTNTDLDKISTYISDYYKNSRTIKKIKNTKYGLLFTFVCFLLLNFSNLLKKQFDTSSLIALIATFLLLIVFFVFNSLKTPIDKFNFYLRKNISTNLAHISITDSKISLEVPPLKEIFDLNSLNNFYFMMTS